MQDIPISITKQFIELNKKFETSSFEKHFYKLCKEIDEDINFDRIHQVMEILDMGWVEQNGKGVSAHMANCSLKRKVPTKLEMIETIFNLYFTNIIELLKANKEKSNPDDWEVVDFIVSTGGFDVGVSYYKNDHTFDVSIKFVLEEGYF